MAPKQTKQTKASAKKPPLAQGTGNKSGTETDKTKDPGRKVPGKKAQAKTTGLEEEEDRTTSKTDKNATNAKATKKPAAAAGRGQGKSEKKKATAVKKLKLKTPMEETDGNVGQQVAFALFGKQPEWLQDERLKQFSRTVN